jgi:hypothetical protein
MQKISFFLLGTVVGAALLGVGGYAAYRMRLLESFIQEVAYTKEDWPDASLPAQATGENPTQLVVEQQSIPVPKEFASAEYQAALTSVYTTLGELSVANNRLTTSLVEMNDRSIAGNFDGFFDIVFRAKNEALVQREVARKLEVALSDLESRRADVEHAPLNSATVLVVETGREMLRVLNSYASAVDVMLSGAVPTSSDIAVLYQTAGELRSSSEVFAEHVEKLGRVLNEYVPEAQ